MSWLGAELPYARAAALFRHFTGGACSRSTVRRATLATGQAVRQLAAGGAAAGAAAGAGAAPAVPMQLSVDGSMLAIVGEGWREARVASLGVVAPDAGDPAAARAEQLSYAAALCDAATFQQEALPEVLRRGLDRAPRVAAVSDGAPWIQDFVDYHCPQAVRILDFAHAASYLASAAQASFGAGAAAGGEWFAAQRHALRHEGPEPVLAALAALPPGAERDAAGRYLGERRGMAAYPAFAAAGWPIGSGSVESAHKHVLQARMKGPGMRWGLAPAQAMIALRVALANGRWDALWPRVAAHQRAARQARGAARRPPPRPPVPPPPPASPPPRPKLVQHGKPTADHPWRRPFLRRPPQAATKT